MPHGELASLHPLGDADYERSQQGASSLSTCGMVAWSFAVRPLAPGERFVVAVGRSQVEVRGTRFTVTAEHDRLAAVYVTLGRGSAAGRSGCRAAQGRPGLDRREQPADRGAPRRPRRAPPRQQPCPPQPTCRRKRRPVGAGNRRDASTDRLWRRASGGAKSAASLDGFASRRGPRASAIEPVATVVRACWLAR